MRGAPDPTSIIRLSTAYWDSQTLLTANRSALFDAWPTARAAPTRWRRRCSWTNEAPRCCCKACAGLGLLTEAGGRFANAPSAATFLVSRSPAYMGNVIRYSDQLYATWGKLEPVAAQRGAGAAGRGLSGRRPGAHAGLRAGDARARAGHRPRAGGPARPAAGGARCSTSAAARAPTRCCSPSASPA
jgi:hypothetical protein